MGDGWVAGGGEKIEAIDCFLITLFKINRPSLNVSLCPIVTSSIIVNERKMQSIRYNCGKKDGRET